MQKVRSSGLSPQISRPGSGFRKSGASPPEGTDGVDVAGGWVVVACNALWSATYCSQSNRIKIMCCLWNKRQETTVISSATPFQLLQSKHHYELGSASGTLLRCVYLLSLYLHVCLSTCMCVYLSAFMRACLSTCLRFCLFTCLCVCVSIRFLCNLSWYNVTWYLAGNTSLCGKAWKRAFLPITSLRYLPLSLCFRVFLQTCLCFVVFVSLLLYICWSACPMPISWCCLCLRLI